MSSFEEKQYQDLWLNDEFLQFIYERLILIRSFYRKMALFSFTATLTGITLFEGY
jgi:hypothetical protein